MKRLIPVAALALVLPACEHKKPEQPPLEVSVTPAVAKDVIVHQTWVGLLDGYQNANVQAQVTGYLLSQNYKEGSFVKKGTVLFIIDARPYEAALAQAEADYAEKVAQAQLSQITLDRQTELFQRKVISAQEYDTAAQNAQAAVALAAAAQANVQSAQVNLAYCTISAPFDGVVGKAQAQIGDLVGPGGTETVLTQISQLDPIKAVFSITETEYLGAAERLQELEQSKDVRDALTMTFANGQPYDQNGRFYFINRQVDTATGTITIETLFPNPKNILRPGLFARVTAPVQELNDAIVVPQKAVVELQGNHLVSVVDKAGKVSTIPVKPGPPDGKENIVVMGKIQVGDMVVVEGVEKVRPGMTVKTTPYEPSGTGDKTSEGSAANKPTPAPTASPSPTATPKPGA